jgi:hypothetical protein
MPVDRVAGEVVAPGRAGAPEEFEAPANVLADGDATPFSPHDLRYARRAAIAKSARWLFSRSGPADWSLLLVAALKW